ncbi:MAG: hypothetical protein SO374_00305 [Eubacteriales bacterium]|nr:hypothetical protein [Christensenellaceae bacterium]MDY2748189.1 hypothetical protein [Eubacteriales bacterium]MCI6943804.1 hypothetical protein [Christensenellaceae bacterium]MDD6938228.1 hypothetical protein [Christensenellaceae bacterium]MDY3976438.1 hypothetical protein [Eubacteriales bacterium]
MEKRSTPNKTAKYVLVFILIAAAAAVLIFSLVNNNKPAQSKSYGESYAAALISDIQGSSAVEYTVKRDSFDHSSVWVLGTESRLNSAIFSPKATLIPAENEADDAVQSIILSMALKEVQLLGTDESASAPGGQFWGTLTLYTDSESATGTAFDIASGLLRLKIRDEQGDNYLLLLFDADAAATDALLGMVEE